jgi:hypothetical protein
MLSVHIQALNGECLYAECLYAECRYAECRYAKCRGALNCLCLKNEYKKGKLLSACHPA